MTDRILDVLRAGYETKRINPNFDMSSNHREIERVAVQEMLAGNIADAVWQYELINAYKLGYLRGAHALYKQNIAALNPNVDISKLEHEPDAFGYLNDDDADEKQRFFDRTSAIFNFSKTRTSYTIDEDLLNSTDHCACASVPTRAFMSTPSYAYMIRNTIGSFNGAFVCYLSDSPNEEPNKIVISAYQVSQDELHSLGKDAFPKMNVTRCVIELTHEYIDLSELYSQNARDQLMITNAVLMICAKNVSIEPSPVRVASQKKFKSIGPLSYADKPDHVVVGTVEGAALRANAQYMRATASEGDDKIKRAAHMRRAHWHHYWTGPRDQPENRKIILHWAAPTFVSGTENEVITNHAVTAD